MKQIYKGCENKMKALVYEGPKKVEVKDIAEMKTGKKEVLIKIEYCGVCGTDIHIYNGQGGAFDVSPPLIMGHEMSGIVEQVGEHVKNFQPGDHVTVNPNNMCGECSFCLNGMEQFCIQSIGTGTTQNGGFAQYCCVDEKQTFKVDKSVSFIEAAMAEPISCCIHGIDLCHIKLGDEVLIIGGGPIGLMMLQLAKKAGASKVILSEPIAEKRKLAVELGADVVINPLEEVLEKSLAQHSRNLDIVIECVGRIETIKAAIGVAGYGSTVMMFGLTGPDVEVGIQPDLIFKKEIKLISSFINPYTFERAISLIESGQIKIKELISDIVPLEESKKVFEDPLYRTRGKIMIKMNSKS